MSIAVLGTAASAVYRTALSLPPKLSADDGEQAGQSLQNAVATADALPETVGNSLLEAAQSAFSAGQSVITTGAAVPLLARACLVMITGKSRSSIASSETPR